MKAAKILTPLGMGSAILYLLHDIIGSLLWGQYNPLHHYLSVLTATGAPNAPFLRIITICYSVAQLLFSIGMVYVSIRSLNRFIQIGCFVFCFMSLTSLFGYLFFPAEQSSVYISHQDVLHSAVNTLVLASSIIAITLITLGYLGSEPPLACLKKLGYFSLVITICITAFGFASTLLNAQNFFYKGLVERIGIYSYHTYVFGVSFFYTFVLKPGQLPVMEQKNPENAESVYKTI